MTLNLLSQFINEHEYDIRKTRNGRWIDQKCALDEVCFVADCITNYVDTNNVTVFQSPDVWHAPYSMESVQYIFGKPDPTKKTTMDEYNKFFRQPMKMLSAAGVLTESGMVNNTIQFSVKRKDILDFIAMRERNSFEFLCLYIEKTLKDSGLWDSFATFFDEQTKDNFRLLKDKYTEFCKLYTPINTSKEAGRIFAKVLNPLACKYHKKGTYRGNLSKTNITFDMLMYNKANWRDISSGKEKNVARGDFNPLAGTTDSYDYRVNKAMRYLKKFNDTYNSGKSEITDRYSVGELATHMHHIFPKNEFKEIADYLENLIAITSGQHLQKAHPNGNTQKIDKEYQYVCLINKTNSIRNNILENHGEPVIYHFDDFMFVLDTGFKTDYFTALSENDFNAVLTGIEFNSPVK